MVKKTKPDGSKTIYVGGLYEVDKTSGGTVTRKVTYYPAGGAMRINIVGGSNTVYYMLKDHLGSASVITDSTGATVGEQRYYPYGETRLSTGTIYTDKLFTGQQEITGLGIYNYRARMYSPKLGRFLSADTIVPNPYNPQDLNRFSYVRNNPVRYNDPTGHMCSDPEDPSPSCGGSSLQSTKVGNKVVQGSGLDAGKPKPSENPAHAVILPIKGAAGQPNAPDVQDAIEDEATDIRDSHSEVLGFVVGTAVGTPFGLYACPGTGPAFWACMSTVEGAANGLGLAGYKILEPTLNVDADKYDDVANALKDAVKNPATGDTISIVMTYQPENGSMVQYNGQDQYLEMNPFYHPEQYVLDIVGAPQSIILTPQQANFINSTVGGGLLP